MAQKPNTQSRPLQTQDVILRLRQCEREEAEALQSLCHRMIEIFKDNPKPSYIAEAAAISAVKDVDLTDLVVTFSNVISQGTTDGNIKERDILNAFTYVLWHAKEPSMRSKLGTVLDCLFKRLEAADTRAEIETQYELVGCLSKVLDAMVEVKFKGLDREIIHTPLLKLLAKLAKSKELRLAQAATYAIQGLRSIPDSEGPWHAVWRHSQSLITIGAKTAGAITTMDPTKIIDAVPNMMELLEAFKFGLEHASEVLKQSTEFSESFTGMWSKAKSWYHALRYTDLLLQCHAWNQFRQLLEVVPCNHQEEFLCGVFSQLEIAWTVADRAGEISTKETIVKLFHLMLESKQQVVLEWRNLVARTIGEDSIEIKLSRLTLRQKRYLSNLKLNTISAVAPTLNASPLLEQAWQRCVEAKLFFADTKIRSFYLDGDLLDIKRLSGDTISMENCYINLAIISSGSKEQNSGFSLKTRLKIEAKSADQVNLEDFFKSRELADGRHIQIKRLLVKGRAGVGKTTLCKKIVYEFLHGLWQDMFTRILWLPLRKLKGRTYNLKSMIQAEYFGSCIEDDDLSDALARKLADPLTEHKTLYLLDGLDEVTQEWDVDTPEYRFLQDLLHKPYVITTSRPFGMKDTKFDLELETIGFLPEQVNTYLEKCINETAIDAIKTFLADKPLIQSLIRIPIQLDALCYCWEAMELSVESAPTTMTMLYEVLWRELWRKDLHRLGIYTESRAQGLDMFEINHQIQAEESLLEWFAFQGLRAGVIDFTSQYQRILTSTWNKLGERLSLPYRQILDESSFMRSSETNSRRDRTYYFLHLTFQEFFAAKYFARHWRWSTQLIELDFKTKTERALNTIEFIRNEKYNPRFNIFWRFVTGLIQTQLDRPIPVERLSELKSRNEGQNVTDFFAQMHAQPIDLLGSTHHHLLMCCLSEVAYSGQIGESQKLLRQREQDLLQEWVSTAWKMRTLHCLGSEPEFPEIVLCHFLQGDELLPYLDILSWLEGRYLTYPETLQTVSNMMDDRFEISVRVSAIKVIFWNSKMASEEMMMCAIRIFRSFLDNIEIKYLYTMSGSMRGDQPLPTEIVRAMSRVLRDSTGNSELRYSIVKGILWSNSLAERFIDDLTGMLKDKEWTLRCCAAEALGNLPLPEKTIIALTAVLSDEVSDVRATAVRILGKNSPLPEKTVVALTAALSDEHSDVRAAAADTLGNMPFLPRRIIAALITMVHDQRLEAQALAIIALSGKYPISEEMVSTLVIISRQILVSDALARPLECALVSALERQPSLSETVINTLIATRVDTSVSDVAVSALKIQKVLSEQAIDSLITALTDENPETQDLAADVLRSRSSLPEKAVTDIVTRMKEGGMRVQKYAVYALGGQSILPEEAIITMAIVQMNEDPGPRISADRGWKGQTFLPKEVITITTTMLMNENPDIRDSAAWRLRLQSSLPEETAIALITAVQDGCYFARYALWNQRSLSRKALAALIPVMRMYPRFCYDLWHSHDAYSLIGALDDESWKCLCFCWIRDMSGFDISLYEYDGSLCIMSDGTMHRIPTNSTRTQELLAILQEVKSELLSQVLLPEENSGEDSGEKFVEDLE